MSLGQRDKPPYDENTPRRGVRIDAPGGRPPVDPGRLRPRPYPGTEDRYDPTVFDCRIHREKTPWYPTERMVPPGNAWVNWTECGPRRPMLHMMARNWRQMVGTSNTRGLQDPGNWQKGLHSNPPIAVARTNPRYIKTVQMARPRQDRLRAGQYAGQSYSQTTRPQGG
jgi:hypothetical protein